MSPLTEPESLSEETSPVDGASRTSAESEPKRRFELATGQGVSWCLGEIRDRFEQNQDPDEVMPFHNTQHTLDVMRRAKDILEVIGASDREGGLLELAGAGHDLVREWQEKVVTRDGQTVVIRGRANANDERASADEVVAYMHKVNDEGQLVFSEADKALVTEAILATVPGSDPKRKVMIQPNLTAESHPIARVLALADIGTAGMDGAAAYITEGNQRFQEQFLDVTRQMRSGELPSAEEQSALRQRILAWTGEQLKFAQDRQRVLDEDLAGFAPDVIAPLKEKFGRFDETIAALRQLAAEREQMSLEDLLRSLSYPVGERPSDVAAASS